MFLSRPEALHPFSEKMAKDGYYFVAPLLLLAGAAFYFGFIPIGIVLFCLALFVGLFFRDPDRRIPAESNAIVSPADGKIVRIEADEDGSMVSIFLSVFDVHVNRAPIGGVITKRDHQKGSFLVAYDGRASVENERLELCITGDRELTFRLIAGIVARRIVVWKQQGERVEKGDRIGLIRFGSRVDIILPAGCKVGVKEGDRVSGGSSILAYWKDTR